MSLPLKTVSRTLETDPVDGWVYRIVEDEEGGSAIFRVPEHSRLWGHGVLKQMYNPITNTFIPTITASIAKVASVAAAAAIIANFMCS